MTKQLKILLYRIGQLGDTVVALPALWAIRRAFPGANLTYLRSEHPGCGHVPAQEVLPPEGLIDDWLTYTLDGRAGIRGMLRLWKSLRKRQFDMLVYLPGRARPRLSVWRDLAFFRSAGIRNVVGHKGLPAPFPRVPGQPLPQLEHEADHLLRRLALSHIPIPSSRNEELDLGLTSRERQTAEDWLRVNVPHDSSSELLVGIGPGSKWQSKLWPTERFAELGKRLVSELPLFPIVFGGRDEVALAKQLIQHWGRGACAAGALGIRATAAVLARCRLFVGNDSGAIHLAAAVRTTCVGIFAAQDWPGRWHPYGSGHIVLRRSVPCEGCFLAVCIKEEKRCLKEITVEAVLEACRSVLRDRTFVERVES